MRKLLWISLFAMAMAYLEAAVVVYLRMIYYPAGFAFPLATLPLNTLAIEIGREVATIIMLAVIGVMAGKTLWSRFAYFGLAFGVWDIFYYVWLKILLNWPDSFLTPDVLFLIPSPWVGPVLAPVLVSLTLIGATIISIYWTEKGYLLKAGKRDWVELCLAGLIIISSFCWDTQRIIKGGIPGTYHWSILGLGEALGIYTFIRVIRKRGI